MAAGGGGSGAGPEANDTQSKLLQAKLAETEALVSEMNITWEDKLKQSQAIIDEHRSLLKSHAASVTGGEDGSLQLASELPNLVHLDEVGRVTVHTIGDPEVRIGAPGGVAETGIGYITIDGAGSVVPGMCTLTQSPADPHVVVTVTATAPLVYVNGKPVDPNAPAATTLLHGSNLQLGNRCIMRFSNPTEARWREAEGLTAVNVVPLAIDLQKAAEEKEKLATRVKEQEGRAAEAEAAAEAARASAVTLAGEAAEVQARKDQENAELRAQLAQMELVIALEQEARALELQARERAEEVARQEQEKLAAAQLELEKQLAIAAENGDDTSGIEQLVADTSAVEHAAQANIAAAEAEVAKTQEKTASVTREADLKHAELAAQLNAKQQRDRIVRLWKFAARLAVQSSKPSNPGGLRMLVNSVMIVHRREADLLAEMQAKRIETPISRDPGVIRAKDEDGACSRNEVADIRASEMQTFLDNLESADLDDKKTALALQSSVRQADSELAYQKLMRISTVSLASTALVSLRPLAFLSNVTSLDLSGNRFVIKTHLSILSSQPNIAHKVRQRIEWVPLRITLLTCSRLCIGSPRWQSFHRFSRWFHSYSRAITSPKSVTSRALARFVYVPACSSHDALRLLLCVASFASNVTCLIAFAITDSKNTIVLFPGSNDKAIDTRHERQWQAGIHRRDQEPRTES